MPRRRSLIAQMYEARHKAKLQRQKLEDQASRAWAEEERKASAQAVREAAQQRREEERAAPSSAPVSVTAVCSDAGSQTVSLAAAASPVAAAGI